jgi:hypothetical protein
MGSNGRQGLPLERPPASCDYPQDSNPSFGNASESGACTTRRHRQCVAPTARALTGLALTERADRLATSLELHLVLSGHVLQKTYVGKRVSDFRIAHIASLHYDRCTTNYPNTLKEDVMSGSTYFAISPNANGIGTKFPAADDDWTLPVAIPTEVIIDANDMALISFDVAVADMPPLQDNTTKLIVRINGHQIANINAPPLTTRCFQKLFPSNLLKHGSNTVWFEATIGSDFIIISDVVLFAHTK